MEKIFFDGWEPVLRTAIIGVMAYVSLVFVLRISGKRTLSKMNAFDLVVTVALGSTLATILLSKDVSLVQGVLALSLLIGMQYVVTWTSVRIRWVRQLVTGEPALVLYQGSLLPQALKSARVTEDEVRAAARSSGFARLEELEAVVLETDGSFSVVPSNEAPTTGSALEGLYPAGSPESRLGSSSKS
ncbi:DUF421 domain-containing protein [Halomonas sp. Bachu 37]|uniref:DUF421 domain-containing protein n=1 Tax=Halomonas kashgarensis TaxID=3084920 RepID=UPI003217AECE